MSSSSSSAKASPSSRTLILGATGKTGQHVVSFLLQAKKPVRVIVRNKSNFSQIMQKLISTSSSSTSTSSLLEIIEKPLGEMQKAELTQALAGCDTVASCLGHTGDFAGMFGSKDKMLCTDAAKNICTAANENKQKINFIMMNTVLAFNPKFKNEWQGASWGLKTLTSVLSYLMPPHWDNCCALNYLVEDLGTHDQKKKNAYVDWIAVRPTLLIDEDKPAPVQAFPSPVGKSVTNGGSISRVSVARFMTDLCLNQALFDKYKLQTPAIYNKLPDGLDL